MRYRRSIALSIALVGTLGLMLLAIRGSRQRTAEREVRTSRPAEKMAAARKNATARPDGNPLRIESHGKSESTREMPVTAPRRERAPKRVGDTSVTRREEPTSPADETRTPLDLPHSGRTQGTPEEMEGMLISIREDALKEKNGQYGYNSRYYGTTLGEGGVEIATAIRFRDFGQPRLSYSFEEIRVGEEVLARGGAMSPQVRATERVVYYNRGSVEEQYILKREALEQAFIITDLPSRGTITVVGRVETNLEPGVTSGEKIGFTYLGEEVLTLSQAVALDAAGQKIALEMAYADGRISITVPADWVATAQLPITIDPLIGGPITVRTLNNAIDAVNSYYVRICDVAYGSSPNNFIVVWDEQFGSSTFDYDVYGQRVSASGTLVGSAIAIGNSTEGDYECTVSYASSVNRYLVVWRNDPANNSSVTDQRINGRVVNGDGTLFTSTFVVDDEADQDFAPSVAFDGTRWYTVYTNVYSQNDHDILGRYCSVTGVPDGLADPDRDTDMADRPSVDFLSNVYVIAWEKVPTSKATIVARTVNGSGAFQTSITTVSQISNKDCRQADVSASATRALIVWRQEFSPSDQDIYGRIATSTLTFDTSAFGINLGTSDQLTPRAGYASNGNEWYVVYVDPITGSSDIYGNRVTSTGSVFAADRITSNTTTDRRPELAYNQVTNEFLIVYLYGSSAPFQVQGQRFSVDFTAPTVPGTPTGTPNPNNTGSHTVTWTASTDSGGSGFSNYELQRSSDGGANFSTIASPTTNSYTESSIAEGNYVYRVRAKDQAGNYSAYSANSAAVVVDKTNPAEPITLGQFKSDGTTVIAVGGSTTESSVVLKGTVNDPGLFDGFEDGNYTSNPAWTVEAGSYAVTTDGSVQVLRDGTGGDDSIYSTATGIQATGTWEYRFRFENIGPGGSVSMQSRFYTFLSSVGLGGNGYRFTATAGNGSSKTISFYRVDGALAVRIIGTDNNWTPDTSYHLVRLTRNTAGLWEFYFDGTLIGSVTDNTYTSAGSTIIRQISTNNDRVLVDYVRSSSSTTARSNVKLQVEVKTTATAFDGTGLQESGFLASGSTAPVTVTNLANGNYHWRARSVDQGGNTGPWVSFGSNPENSADFVVTAAVPPTPTNFNGTAVSSTSITWTWDDVAGESGYEVHDDAHNVKGTVGANVTSFTETGLTENTLVSRHVHAMNNAQPSAASNTAAKYTRVHDPTVSDFTPLIVSQTSVEITVTQPPNGTAGSTGCEIQRTSDFSTWTVVKAFSNVYVYTDSTVSSSLLYRYRIRYRNGDAVVGPESASILIAFAPTPLKPVSGTSTNDTTPTFEWTSVPGKAVLTYELQADNTSDFATPEVNQVGIASTTFTSGVLAENVYYWRVRAKYAGANTGPWSIVSTLRIDTTVPGVATLVSPANSAFVGTTRPTFDWTDVSDPSGVTYRLQVDNNSDFSSPEVNVGSISASTYTTPAITVGTYYWRVQATDLAGNSGSYSGSFSFQIDVTAPAAVTLQLPANDSVVATGTPTFQWTTVTDPAGVTYTIQVDTESTFSTPLMVNVSGLTGNTHTPSPALAEGTYVWRVKAVDGAGNTSTSTVFKVTVDLSAAPSAPTINFSSERKTNDSTPAITGKSAEPGVTIKVYFDAVLDGTTTADGSGNWTYSPTATRFDGVYSVQAKANNANGDSAWSNLVSVTIDTKVNPPTNVTATPLNTHIHLSWVASVDSDVIGYEVYRKLASDPDTAYAKIHSNLVVQTKYCDSTVVNGTQYCYRIKAVDNTLQE